MDELSEFHPIVASWLEEHGYEYIHEYCMPWDGIVDFLAIDSHETLLVECKTAFQLANIEQINRYAKQLPSAVPVLAIPMYLLNDRVRELCQANGIRIVPIDVQHENFVSHGCEPDFDETTPIREHPGFIPLPSDPALLTVEHARLVFTDAAANRAFIRELVRLEVKDESEGTSLASFSTENNDEP